MGIVVLSLFDGLSCGKVAFDRLGVKVEKYFASEIDKDAIKISDSNHDDIIRIGDVSKVSYVDGVLKTEFGCFDVPNIDFLIGGSPCQSFSKAALLTGNQTKLDGKSKLFYEYLRILKEIMVSNPNLKFLLENVKMDKISKSTLDAYLGCYGKLVNSELLSFQKRPRYYWTNWEWSEPLDKNISFQDYKQQSDLSKFKVNKTPSRERMWNNGNGNSSISGCANITNSDKVYCLTTKQDRCPNSGLIEYEDFCRYLTQNELEQAQTLPIGYTKVVSYNKACKALGNGWTVDVIVHILSFLDYDNI